MKLIIGTSLQEFGSKIDNAHLDVKIVDTTIDKFSNGEIKVLINESIRGKDIFILQTGMPTKDSSQDIEDFIKKMKDIQLEMQVGISCYKEGEEEKISTKLELFDSVMLNFKCFENIRSKPKNNINDIIMETLIIIDACVAAGARATLFLLNYPYARQDKRIKRESIAAKLLAECLTKCKLSRIITVDLHASQIQGFFGITCDNLYALKTICNYLDTNYFKNQKNWCLNEYYILVSPDNGGAKRIDAYSRHLGINNVIMHKERNYVKSGVIENMTIVGDLNKIKGKTAIIVDDMIDTASTMISAARILVKNGAQDIIIAATHGIFSGNALNNINDCPEIKSAIVTNTIPQEENKKICKKIEVADISELIYDVMKCLETGISISNLFD